MIRKGSTGLFQASTVLAYWPGDPAESWLRTRPAIATAAIRRHVSLNFILGTPDMIRTTRQSLYHYPGVIANDGRPDAAGCDYRFEKKARKRLTTLSDRCILDLAGKTTQPGILGVGIGWLELYRALPGAPVTRMTPSSISLRAVKRSSADCE